MYTSQQEKQLLQFDKAITDLFMEYGSRGRFEEQLFVPSDEKLSQLRRRGMALLSELDAAGLPDNPITSHFREALDVLDARLTDDPAYPSRLLSGVVRQFNDLVNLDQRPWEVRQELFMGKLDQLPPFLDAVVDLGARVSADSLGLLREQWESFDKVLARLRQSMADGEAPSGVETDDVSQDLVAKLDEALDTSTVRQERLAGLEASEDPDLKGLAYPDILKRIFGLPLDKLKKIAVEGVEREYENVQRIARSIDPDRSYTDILEQDLGPCDTVEEMFGSMEKYVAMARERSLELITLPEGEVCHVWPVPEQLQSTYPWGGSYGPDAFQGLLEGAVFLNQVNFDSVTRGWLEMMAIHECYPGHHAQRVKTTAGALPETMKIGGLTFRSSSLNEGIAHRAEEQLQDLFPEKEFPLFVAYRRLHTAVRIRVEMDLFVYGKSIDHAVDLYVKYLNFARPAARGQVRFQELWPGYMNSYYYGYHELCRLQEKYGVPEAEFTELTFSNGYVSLDTIEQLLQMTPEEREAVYAPFRA